MRLFFSFFLLTFYILPPAKAQDTLPGFTASIKSKGKVLVSWRNPYPAINQISIQRSKDSLRNFTTLISVPDPRIPENGFVDSKATDTKMYYRIFILFPDSKYMFTRSRRPILEPLEQPAIIKKSVVKENPKSGKQPNQPAFSNPAVQKQIVPPDAQVKSQVPAPVMEEEKYLILPKIDNSRIYYMMETANLKKPSVSNPAKMKTSTIEVDKILFVKRRDSVIMRLAGNRVSRFSDSLMKQTKDTLFFVNADTLQINPFIEIYKEPKEVYKISPYIFTAKDGNVMITLSDCNRKKYFVSFFEIDNTPVLEVKDIRDPILTIDKTNFGHAGWFRFELYEDGKLKEKNKFLIPRD
jgi:hypothetical protein